jgi:hypothetical protein
MISERVQRLLARNSTKSVVDAAYICIGLHVSVLMLTAVVYVHSAFELNVADMQSAATHHLSLSVAS